MSSDETAPIAMDKLERWAFAVLERIGVQPEGCSVTSKALVLADGMGVRTHGLVRLCSYHEKLERGQLNSCPQIRSSRVGSMLIVDADRALGQLAATKAIEWASEMLSEEPMVGIIIHSTGHLGAIGGLILDVATRGDIAFLAQSNRPVMAPLGAIRPAIGNNPFAFAAPRSGGILLVDLACSAVSFGRIIEVARKHGNIPVDWATDNEGRATTNPEEAMRGALLPAAGHKGIGLAMMIEVLAGILGSAVFGSASSTLDAGGGNAFGFLIRPEKLANVGAFESQIANWASEYERAAGSACHFPGSGSLQRLRQARIAGISYELELMKELTAFGDSVGISLGFEPP